MLCVCCVHCSLLFGVEEVVEGGRRSEAFCADSHHVHVTCTLACVRLLIVVTCCLLLHMYLPSLALTD